jgi:hypothetical protein
MLPSIKEMRLLSRTQDDEAELGLLASIRLISGNVRNTGWNCTLRLREY